MIAAGAISLAAPRAMAAWIVFLARGRDAGGRELPLDAPLVDRSRVTAAEPDARLADRMLAPSGVFPEAVGQS
jgi:fructuronate reductase